MTTRLRLLDQVSWEGRPVAGERSQGLLAALATARGRAVSEADLVDAVWGDGDHPAQPGRALQVVVSRTRSQTERDVVVRVERGYRLGVDPDDLDLGRLATWAQEAASAERAGDLAVARDRATLALGIAVATPGDDPPALADLRAAARDDQRSAGAVLGRAASAVGEHAEALAHLTDLAEPDEPTLAALLRSEAAVHGASVALARYARHRTLVRDELGVDPGPVLQAVHAELLAADHPVRAGLLHDTTSLVGREDDVRALRAAVRTSRVVSIMGPGGLGKTRLAHLLGRGAEQSVVHFVELVGVASPDDVVGEVGSLLGVRDSVSGRRVLSVEQRADVRARIAQQLGAVPTLLILDNCEHVVGAVADLVAFLVAATPGLRVVTTTRASLGIAAERVFPLGQLDEDAAADLFGQRARAARPGVLLDDEAVRRVVRRLDGLPLAIELAAAKVRAMSVDDIDRRLDDRFALLRGNDVSAPDRHRTLLAVIDWSWHLLAGPERRALSRLSLLHDGFGLDAAEALLGPDAFAAVESLVGQSLLTVREDAAGLRYRMLETVREFGRQQLGDDAAEAARLVRDWALGVCRVVVDHLAGAREVEAVRALGAEENNLADALRDALAVPDQETTVVLLAALGGVWTIKGEHVRVVAMAGAVDVALRGWTPPPALVDVTARAVAMMAMNTAVADLQRVEACWALLETWGEVAGDADTRALARVLLELDRPDDPHDPDALARLAEHPERPTAVLALAWASHGLENDGDVEGALDAATRALALWRPEDGIWGRARLHTQLAELHAQVGHVALAADLAALALDALDALEASDDATQLRAVLASAAIVEGRLDDAERIAGEMATRTPPGAWGGSIALHAVQAELCLARGEVEAGLALHQRSVEAVRTLHFPGSLVDDGLQPWTLYAESAAVTAHARHGQPPSGQLLRDVLAAKALPALDPDRARIDYPVAGCVLVALGAWELNRGEPDTGIALLALAERFGYSRQVPSLSWTALQEAAEARRPGALPAALASYDGRRAAAVLPDARAVVTDLLGR